jgi:hypothetical protein
LHWDTLQPKGKAQAQSRHKRRPSTTRHRRLTLVPAAYAQDRQGTDSYCGIVAEMTLFRLSIVTSIGAISFPRATAQ